MAEGNLPTLVRHCKPLYRISTTRRDQAKMREMAIFQEISKLVEVEFVDTPSENPDPIFHMHWHVDAVNHARQHDAIYFMLWPDVVFPENTLGNAGRAISNGSAGGVLPTIRVVSETCVPDVIQRYPRSGAAPMTIPPGDVVRMAVRHMHPLSATSMVDAVHGRPDTCLLFRVPNEGLISRSSSTWLYLEPGRLIITPEGGVSTDDPDPSSLIHVVTDSDDMFFLSLAPLLKELEVLRPNHRNAAIDVTRMTLHPWLAVSTLFEHFDKYCTRLHYGPMNEALWAPIIRRSEEVFRQVRMSRAFLRIWEELKKRGCTQVARLMSLALLAFRLPNHWFVDQPVTVFVPSDNAIERRPEPFTNLMTAPRRKSLITAMLDHVVVGTDFFPDRHTDDITCVTATGRHIAIRATSNGFVIDGKINVVADFRSGPHRVIVMDQCFEGDPRAVSS